MMKDFIVWYSNGVDKFSKEFTLDELISQLHYDEICDSPLLKDYKVIEVCQSVGSTDINNNKIYADCSIVEFWFDNGFERVYLTGVFTFNDCDLRYEIDILNNNKYVCLDFVREYFRVFKIVDTIQENKLGLIK